MNRIFRHYVCSPSRPYINLQQLFIMFPISCLSLPNFRHAIELQAFSPSQTQIGLGLFNRYDKLKCKVLIIQRQHKQNVLNMYRPVTCTSSTVYIRP